MNRSPTVRFCLFASLLLFSSISCGPSESNDQPRESKYEELTSDYVEAWKEFYPTSAVRRGLDQYLAMAEDRSPESISGWIDYHDQVWEQLNGAPDHLSPDLRIDLRLLRRQVKSELTQWKEERVHETSPTLYSGLIRGLVDVPASPKRIGGEELEAAVANRISAVPELSKALAAQLTHGSEADAQRAVRALQGALGTLGALPSRFPGAEAAIGPASEAIEGSIEFIKTGLETVESEAGFPLGRERFAEELREYYDMEITPEEVAERALAEIEEVRGLIAEVSTEYWKEAYPNEPLPDDIATLVAQASADMEDNRPSSEQEALARFSQFADEAEVFVREKRIATLPAEKTLEIVLTPESAGPSQRIGFVASPPPFDPEPMTTLSLPTIPDTHPEREKEDFYRSFNNHFNKMIIIHELFPGHYMQQKIASGNPRTVRIFFPYQPYVEGWATLTEKFALDAGWDDFNKLTYLSHLRKRLENANRAYNSVQVHCFGWTKEQVDEFSQDRALLAPQFAKSLFGRLERGPMQMTSYFMGKDMFMDVLEAEQARLGDAFDVLTFNDIILNAGAVHMDMLPPLLASAGG